MVMITVMTLFVGTIMAVHLVQHRFMRRDLHRLQARYTAEAGLYTALSVLHEDIHWRTEHTAIPLPNEKTSWVTVESFGAFIRIISAAKVGEARMTLQALIGQAPPAVFDDALILDDPSSGLNLAGRTRITGDLMVGQMGVQESLLEGRPFAGHLQGQIRSFSASKVPTFDANQAQAFVKQANSYLQGYGLPSAADSLHVIYAEGDLHVDSADSSLFDRPVWLIAVGTLTLEGAVRYRPGSVFVAGQEVRLQGNVTGRGGLFYGKHSITITDHVTCTGQFFSDERVQVMDHAYLRYPSLLYLSQSGQAPDMPGLIEVTGEAVVDGIVVYPYHGGIPEQGQVIVGSSATVRGSLYNQYSTELRGTVAGTLITHQLRFYESPTTYVNWLYDAVIDRSQRPPDYGLPVGFGHTDSPIILELNEVEIGAREKG